MNYDQYSGPVESFPALRKIRGCQAQYLPENITTQIHGHGFRKENTCSAYKLNRSIYGGVTIRRSYADGRQTSK